jgi:EmrB/QacA subfamily drug resistance transporter
MHPALNQAMVRARVAERGRATERIILPDGRQVRLRPLRREDRAGLARLFARLSPESRRRRFLGAKPRLTAAELDRLSDVGHPTHEAVAAIDESDGSIVGVSRYVADPACPTVAEVAMEIADDFQTHGLGRALGERTLLRARANGVDKLTAILLWENVTARALARRLGFQARRRWGSEVEMARELRDGDPVRADVDPSQRFSPSRRGRVLALLCLIYFLVILDAAIVRLTLPSIQRALGLSPAEETWVTNAYMLSFGTLLLLGGRLADLLGRKRMLLAGVGVFACASLACGLAPSGGALIAARAVQGLGAAAMTPAALSILMRTFPEGTARNRAIGAWGATGGIAATAAWIIGGALVSSPGWQWVFWINVPLGLVIAGVAVALLPESRDASATRNFDIVGVVSVTAALVAFVYALVEAPTAGWTSAQTLALLGLSLALFGIFATVERHASAPLVPPRIAGARTLLAANLGLGLTAASIYGMAFIISLYGQDVLDYSALKFGVAAVVLPVGAALGAGIGQALVTRWGVRVISAVGIGGLAVGFVLLARLPVHGSYAYNLLPGLVLVGVPIGLAFTAYSVATLTGVASRDAGLASGLNNTFEQVGGAIGTALMATIATARTGNLLHAGAGHLVALDRGIQLAFATAIAFPVSGLIVSLVLLRQRRPPTAIDPLETATAVASGAEC